MEIKVKGRAAAVIPSDMPDAPLIVVSEDHGTAEELVQAVKKNTEKPFSLASVNVTDWNRELSPWPNKAVFKGTAPFAGECDAYLEELNADILPRIRACLPGKPAYQVIAGYSLAGLAALYAMYRTDSFQRFVSASGSLWYPGFLEYAQEKRPVNTPDAVYLSLGDAEAKTNHPLLKTVQEKTEAFFDLYQSAGIPTVFEQNPGNHFDHPQERLARGIAWVLEP